MPDQSEDPVYLAIKQLGSAQTKHPNRQLACEALLYSMLYRIDPQALAGLAEEYDLAVDRLAVQVPPSLQMPELWAGFADAIADRRKALAPQPPPKPDGAD